MSVSLSPSTLPSPDSASSSSAGMSGLSRAGATKERALDATPSSDSSSPSTVVTLSVEAQAFASLADKGITVTASSLESVQQPSGSSADALAKFAAALRRVSIAPPTDGKTTTGAVSVEGFENLASKFNASKDRADAIFKTLDQDNNGVISNGELLNALAQTAKSGASDAATALKELMNKDGSATVDGTELLNFETAFVAAEKSR